jgi:hypothetical protein
MTATPFVDKNIVALLDTKSCEPIFLIKEHAYIEFDTHDPIIGSQLVYLF